IAQNVFRGDQNFPATVEEVVESGGHTSASLLGCYFRQQTCDAVEQALKRADITHLKKKRIGELSGGERQRVFIARALVSRPELLVLDEPTTGVDVATEAAFYAFLETLHQAGMTIILVSHDLEAIAREVKTVMCLNRRLVYVGTPDHLHSQTLLNEMYGQRKQMIHHTH
ncbi:MAG TPA: metal ABC transporter ATP-binding protein, partial [Patescibacteria group bacterium]|nr:metal ABC transporter ATP-binding protein [Patescibacteria group bacterium]